MTTRGRPRSFDRDAALLAATRLFWARGYDGTSLADLRAAMGISTSSLYAAFEDKKALFEEAVLGYTARYTAIYADACLRPTARAVAERALRASVDEFTDPDRPMGCLTVSAAMQGGADTVDVRGLLRAEQERLSSMLVERFTAEPLPAGNTATGLADWVQTLWQGLSNQAGNGMVRDRLHDVVTVAMRAWPVPGAAEG